MASRYVAEYESTANLLPGQSLDWLNALRAEAFTKFSKQGFPSLREEEWRYTNVSAIEKKLFSPQANVETSTVDKHWLECYRLENALTVVLVDGHFSKELSTLENVGDVSILGMADALEQQPELVKQYLGQAVSNEEHGFVAFNTAWFTDGLFVHVPANQVLDKPIQLLHLVTQADVLATSRNILVVDEMAEVKVIETFVGVDDAYLSAAVTEVFVGKNADLTLYKMQSEGEKAYHFGGTYIKQA